MAQNLDLRYLFDPSTLGAGAKIRLEFRRKTFTPHCTFRYIRCVKPNGDKASNSWDEAAILHQVKYLGLMENLRVARAGQAHNNLFLVWRVSYIHKL